MVMCEISHLKKVKIDKTSVDLFGNLFLLFCMKISQIDIVFKVTKIGLYAPSPGIEVF